jgi:hypothetical protein
MRSQARQIADANWGFEWSVAVSSLLRMRRVVRQATSTPRESVSRESLERVRLFV